MTRLLFAVYGLLAYLFFFGTFLYAAAFVANIPGLKTMDTGSSGTLTEAIVVDLLLLGLFAVQHSAWHDQRLSAGGPSSCRRHLNAAPTCFSQVRRSRCCSGSGNRWAGRFGPLEEQPGLHCRSSA